MNTNLSMLESDLSAAKTRTRNLLNATIAACQAETRLMTATEKAALERAQAEVASLQGRVDPIRGDQHLIALINGTVNHPVSGDGSDGVGSVGALFAANEEIRRFIASGGHRASGAWRTPAVDVPYGGLFATTLTESPTSGGKLVVPDYRPGIVATATRPIVVMDLLIPGTTNSNSVTVMVETTFTNAAAAVAEGIAKPESALVFDQVAEPVLKVAHWLPVTEELLEDAPAISSYIDGRLRLGVQLAEDDQILNGNGTLPNYRGLLLRATAPTITQGAGENIMDAIKRQITQIATTAFVEPSGLVMHPSDVAAVQSSKTSTGDYYGAGPFGPVTAPSLWNLPIAVTPAIAAKTVLVGAFSTMAQFFRKGGIRVEASNSHQDFFIKNLVAIRAEERGALACYRPAAFGKVTLL